MEDLLLEFRALVEQLPKKHYRYLFNQVDVSQRLVALKGARGSGKTTLLLQLAKEKMNLDQTLYVSLEHIYFYHNNLYELAKAFERFGGKNLLLDEVHKYPNWSREIKLIYDNLPRLSIFFTSSSLLELHHAEADLSRRLISYHLKELSFREFILFDQGIELPAVSLEKLLKKHNSIAQDILERVRPLPLFRKYLEKGQYPYYFESEQWYTQKLRKTIDLTIETDVLAIEQVTYESLLNLKKLLMAIASSAPFTPNISKLSRHIGITRNQLVLSIKTLERAGLLIGLFKDRSGIGALTKPEKLFLHNTNLMHALVSKRVSDGTIRETFFVNQLKGLYPIHLSPRVDFILNHECSIEVGGKNKKKKQLENLENAFIAKDDIEIGAGNIIPLWLFGFLY